MSAVIDVLERMGQDAQWGVASQDALQLALAAAEITPELQAAIVAGDQNKLQALLGITPPSATFFPGQDDEKEDEDRTQKPPGKEDDKPEQLTSSAQLVAG